MAALDGKRVIVVGRGSPLVPVAVGALETAGAAVELVDVPPDGDTGASVEAAISRLGGVDVLANLMASPGPPIPASEVTRAQWEGELEALLRATRTSNQAAFRVMAATGGGDIVNLADQSALGQSNAAMASAAAQAITAFSMACAGAWSADHVHVNVLQPSAFADPASTIAPVLVFLAGDVALHGQTVTC